MNSKHPLKFSATAKEYTTQYKGYTVTVPEGWPVSNNTACGPDDSYRFAMKTKELATQVTGLPDSILAHDLKYYGLNIPSEYCNPWREGQP